MDKVVIGVDMAKDKFDFFVEGKAQKLLNTVKGHRQFVKLVSRYDNVHVVMEATGNYHLHLATALSNADIMLSIINPLRLKRFSQMKLSRIKTDAADAKLLTEYGLEQNPPLTTLKLAVQQQLKQLNTSIAQLMKQRTALKNLIHANSHLPHIDPTCSVVLKRMLKQQNRAIEHLEKKLTQLTDKSYSDTKKLMMTISGIGTRTAGALIAYVGDLSTFETHKQLAAFMGLNPVPYESGTMKARSHISKQGNAKLRTLFYMCALSARRHNKDCKKLYARLRAAGKEAKVALIAVANKLIRQVFAVVKSGVAFDNDYVEKSLQRT